MLSREQEKAIARQQAEENAIRQKKSIERKARMVKLEEERRRNKQVGHALF